MSSNDTPPAPRWPQASLLVVDDEPGMRHFLQRALAPRVAQVHAAGSAEEAEVLLARHRYDVLVLDITLPGKSGITLLQQLRAQGHNCEVVLITAFADLDTAIEALRAGAGDFLLKPFRLPQVLTAVQRALERSHLRRENWVLKRTLSQRTPPADGLVGSSMVVKGLQAALRRVADIPELVAHFIATPAPRLGVPPIAVSADEMRYLQQYAWPGNVRELRNLLERSLIVGALNVSALYQSLQRHAATTGTPRVAAAEPPAAVDLQTLERRHIQAVLDSVAGDKTRAAALLGISRRTLERRHAEWQQPPAG